MTGPTEVRGCQVEFRPASHAVDHQRERLREVLDAPGQYGFCVITKIDDNAVSAQLFTVPLSSSFIRDSYTSKLEHVQLLELSVL